MLELVLRYHTTARGTDVVVTVIAAVGPIGIGWFDGWGDFKGPLRVRGAVVVCGNCVMIGCWWVLVVGAGRVVLLKLGWWVLRCWVEVKMMVLGAWNTVVGGNGRRRASLRIWSFMGPVCGRDLLRRETCCFHLTLSLFLLKTFGMGWKHLLIWGKSWIGFEHVGYPGRLTFWTIDGRARTRGFDSAS